MIEVAGLKGEPGFENLAERLPVPLDARTHVGRAMLAGRTLQIAPIVGNPEAPPITEQSARDFGYNSQISTPLVRDGTVIGVIGTMHRDAAPFNDKQVALIESFAAQAVIAIENTRLLNELRESLQQQTATADVLKVISRSTFDLQAVLQTLVESAVRLCEADSGHIARPNEAGFFQSVANYGMSPEFIAVFERIPFKAGRDSVMGRALLERKPVHIADAQTDPDYKLATAQKIRGRSLLGVPLMREGTPVGVIAFARYAVKPFTDKQIELVETFADQAVIAMENVRLFDEVQARTDDLSESLEQQTATSEVLRVISSSPGELEPVFQAMLEKAVRICEAKFGTLFRYGDRAFYPAAMVNAPSAYAEFMHRRESFQAPPGTLLDRLLRTRDVIHVADDATAPTPSSPARLGGARSTIAVPMLKDDELIGAIVIYLQEVRPFTEKQIELVTSFANQAVIAIENTRLLNELRESLQQQTATADVLKVISSSPGELEPVFRAMLENATRICEAKCGNLFLREQDSFRAVARHGAPAAYAEFRQR